MLERRVQARSANQARGEPPDRFDYDPANPPPTPGGRTRCTPWLIPWAPLRIEHREDMLVYTMAPVESDTEVIGPMEVHLTA